MIEELPLRAEAGAELPIIEAQEEIPPGIQEEAVREAAPAAHPPTAQDRPGA